MEKVFNDLNLFEKICQCFYTSEVLQQFTKMKRVNNLFYNNIKEITKLIFPYYMQKLCRLSNESRFECANILLSTLDNKHAIFNYLDVYYRVMIQNINYEASSEHYLWQRSQMSSYYESEYAYEMDFIELLDTEIHQMKHNYKLKKLFVHGDLRFNADINHKSIVNSLKRALIEYEYEGDEPDFILDDEVFAYYVINKKKFKNEIVVLLNRYFKEELNNFDEKEVEFLVDKYFDKFNEIKPDYRRYIRY